MPIYKEFKAPNGAFVKHHVLSKIESSGEFAGALVIVNSFDSQEAEAMGRLSLWCWTVPLPSVLITEFSKQGLETVLTTVTDSPFFGGVIVPSLGTLEAAKIMRWAVIKVYRDAAEFGSFTWDGSTFDSDQISQSRIQGAVQLAQLALSQGQPFSIDWTLADNTSRTLNAIQMISVGVDMGEHINACHMKARMLREQINAATTKEELDVIQW